MDGNLVVPPGTDGIDIAANSVTLDLDGFAIQGAGAEVSGSAISTYNITVNYLSILIRNGSFFGWNSAISGTNCDQCAAKQLIANRSLNGIVLGNGALVSDNVVASGRSDVANEGTVGIAANDNGSFVGNNASGFGAGIKAQRNSILSTNVASGSYFGINVGYPVMMVGNFASGSHVDIGAASGGGCVYINNSPDKSN